MRLKNVLLQDSGSYFNPEEKIWSGETISPFVHQDVSVGQISLFALGLNPQKVIQICATTGEQLTGQELVKLSIRVAHHFKVKLGLQQEDVVGLMANNSTYVAPVALGAFLAGTPLNPLHHGLKRKTVTHVFGLTKPKVVFCDVENYNELVLGLEDINLSCKIFTINGRINGVANVHELFEEFDSEEYFVPAVLEKGGDQTAVILCTSGTTGVPKGVCISHHNLLGRRDFSFMLADDVLFTFSTLYWITGIWILVQNLTGTLRVITDKPFSPELFLEIIEKYKVTQIIGPPAHASLSIQCPDITRRDLSSVHSYICGGAPLSISVAKKLSKYLRKHSLREGYGLTELGGMASSNRLLHEKEGSVGRLCPNTKAKIVSDDEKPLGIGEVGEIHLWSPFKWAGYFGSPELTRLALDPDGWLKTGDLGYFDQDGFLYICGRWKDVLKHRNYMISPFEIEEVIQKMPGVIEVCVFGVPDPIEEDMPTAAVVKSPECHLTEEDICKTVASCLPEAKHLHGGVIFLEELPKSLSGKVQRNKMLAIFEDLHKVR